jgi:hypothetical protein
MPSALQRSLLSACLCVLPLLAQAATPAQQWFTVLLDGRKIGSFESNRTLHDGQVVTTQALDLVLDRVGVQVTLSSRETATETLAGKPLAFSSVSRLSGSEIVVEGVVHAGKVGVVTRSGGEETRRSLAWPEGALLAEGQRQAGMRAGLVPGTRYRMLSFQPSSLDAIAVTSVVGTAEPIDLPRGRLHLSPVEQTIEFPGAPMHSRSWVDANQAIHKLTMPLMGVELILLACDRACATAPNQGSDVFTRTLARAPRPLPDSELAGTMRYTLTPRDGGAPLAFPQTDEQRVVRDGKAAIVTIGNARASRLTESPEVDDFLPNDWLQSKAPEIVGLARRATGDADTPLERMRRIEQFVRGYIETKSLDIGYASALEVARHPEGDCTEHALLVAALGRASGIATRVVDGLAYAPGFAGKGQVFVPHAWTQAWIEGRWQSFDAALSGFDAGHIAFAVGDGDPWRFYAGLDMLGRIHVERAEAVPAQPAH